MKTYLMAFVLCLEEPWKPELAAFQVSQGVILHNRGVSRHSDLVL